MATPLEIVITKRNALALIREAGWALRKRGSDHWATRKRRLGELFKWRFDSRKGAIQTLAAYILQDETTRPVRVQF